MPSWQISHSAANLSGKTIEIGVEEVRWARPGFKSGVRMSPMAVFTIEGQRVERIVSFSVHPGDRLSVDYVIDPGGRVLIKQVRPSSN
jgi:hypothetical protein